jgi:hypothetical protein
MYPAPEGLHTSAHMCTDVRAGCACGNQNVVTWELAGLAQGHKRTAKCQGQGSTKDQTAGLKACSQHIQNKTQCSMHQLRQADSAVGILAGLDPGPRPGSNCLTLQETTELLRMAVNPS